MASPGRAPATLRCRPDGLASRLGGPPEGGCVPILGFQLACGGSTKFPAQLSCDKRGGGGGFGCQDCRVPAFEDTTRS